MPSCSCRPFQLLHLWAQKQVTETQPASTSRLLSLLLTKRVCVSSVVKQLPTERPFSENLRWLPANKMDVFHHCFPKLVSFSSLFDCSRSRVYQIKHRSVKRSVQWLQFGVSPCASGLPKLVFKPVSLLLKYHLIITLISVSFLPILNPSTNHFINLPSPPFILSPHQFSHADRQQRFPQATSGLRVAFNVSGCFSSSFLDEEEKLCED